jgi:hypothetical protein
MSKRRIYADFNGLQNSIRTSGYVALYLHYFGSMRDLARTKVHLREGIELDVYSDSDEIEDLVASGLVYFDQAAKQWFVEFDETAIRYVTRPPEPVGPKFPCWSCGAELYPLLTENGVKLKASCPHCGRGIDELLSPPT